MENNQPSVMYTEEQLMARLKFFIGICLALTLFGIVFVVLYSLIFVTQPLNAISPIDQKQALAAANAGWSKPPSPSPTGGFGNGATIPGTGFASGTPAFGAPQSGFGAAPGTSFTPAPSWGTTPIPGGGNSNPGFGAPAITPFGAAAVGAAGGFAAATMMPTMAKPMPSRPPFDENFPEID